MDPASLDASRACGERDVERLALQPRLESGPSQNRAASRQRVRHPVFERVDRRPRNLALVRGQFAQPRQQLRDRPLLAERGDAHAFQRALVSRGLNRG